MKPKLLLWLIERLPFAFFKKKTENAVVKTAAEKTVAGLALAKSIKESSKAFEQTATRYFKSSDSTISTAVLNASNGQLHPNSAAVLYAQMKVNNQPIIQAYGQLIKPITKLKEKGAITNADYEGFKQKIDEMFVLKFKAEMTKSLKADFRDAVSNMITRNSTTGATAVNYAHLKAIVRNKPPEMKSAIVNEVVKQINKYVETDAKAVAMNALRGQPTPVNMTNVSNRLNSLNRRSTSASPFAYSIDIYRGLNANGLISQQELTNHLYAFQNPIFKGYEEAIKLHNSRGISMQRPNR